MSVDVLRRFNVQVRGSGTQTLVFAHGFGCDQRLWRFVAPRFEATHRVVLFDLVGSGGSDPDAYDDQRHGSLQGYAEDVIEMLDALGAAPVDFIGHSASSLLGVLASIARPDLFRRLLLVAPSPRFLNDPPHYRGGFDRAELEGLFDLMESNHFGWANFLAPLAMGAQSPAGATEELEASMCALDPHIARRFARLVFLADIRDQLPRVPVPALILQCLHDSIAPREVGAFMQREMPGSTLVEIDAAGHLPHVTHPEQTARILAGYLGGARAND